MGAGLVTVSVVVPRSPGSCPDREAAWEWCARWWTHHFPTWEVVEGFAPAAGWSKGTALADAVAKASGDVLVVADADVLVPPGVLRQAVDLVGGGAPWVVPHGEVHRLDPPYTRSFLGGGPEQDLTPPARRHLSQLPYSSVPGGGISVLTRAAWEVAPVDPRFVEWGGEDDAWGRALDTLMGRHVQIEVPLLHLWHPPQSTRRRPTRATNDLVSAYKRATHAPRLMSALVAGGDLPDPLPPLDPPTRFDCRGLRWVRPLGRKVNIPPDGLVEVDDPDVADAMRSIEGVEEVLPCSPR